MAKADQTFRRDRIRELLAQRGSVGVEELSGRFEVTTMTIRRDLAAMERSGLLLRTHGGCVLQAPMVRELSFSEKIGRRSAQKAAIASEAVKLLSRGQSLYLDTGTTALHLARQLPSHIGLRVSTNNIRVALELFGRDDIEVIVLGGVLARRSADLVGTVPFARLPELHMDVAMLGADAVDPVRGEWYAADIPTAELSRAARERSDRHVLLADSSKLNSAALAVVGRIERGMTVITDEGASERDLRALAATGAEIIVAEVNEEGPAPER